jgi:translation initiation factor 1 (eIF-1/SUI1)
MGRKGKRRDPAAPLRPPEFKVNPFADLRAQAVVGTPPAPVAAAAHTPEPGTEVSGAHLDAEDRKLLDAFGCTGSMESRVQAAEVRVDVARRSGGRTVTTVRGLRGLSVLDLMDFTAALRQDLGLVARFRENVLEVEGEVRTRLVPWLASRGYAVADAGRESGRPT